MMKGMEAVDASLYNLLVYVDDASREGSQSYKFPTLYRLSKDKNGNVVKETVKEYKEQVSTDPAVMQEVLKRALLNILRKVTVWCFGLMARAGSPILCLLQSKLLPVG